MDTYARQLLNAVDTVLVVTDPRGIPIHRNDAGAHFLSCIKLDAPESLFPFLDRTSGGGLQAHIVDKRFTENRWSSEISLTIPCFCGQFTATIQRIEGDPDDELVLSVSRAGGAEKLACELAKRDLYLTKLQNIGSVGICCVDLEPHLVEWSDHLFAILGYDPSRITPTEELLLSHITDADRSQVQQQIETALKMKRSVIITFTFTTTQGEARFGQIHFENEWFKSGELRKKRYVFQDISSQKKKDIQLAQSEEWFRSFFKKDESIKLIIEPGSGQIRDANSAAISFYGYDRETLLSMHIQAINQIDEAEMRLEMRKALSNEKNHFLFTHKLASGELREVEVFPTPVTIDGENLLYVIVHDVAAREAAKVALLESERRLQAFYALTQEAILIHHNGIITDMNSSFERLFDVSRKDQMGHSVNSLFKDPEQMERWEALLNESRDQSVEATFILPSKEQLFIEAITKDVHWNDRKQKVTCLLDISLRKRMEEHLRQGQRLSAIGQLAGGVAHDFNNLLGAIFGFTDISISVLPPDHEVIPYLQKIKSAGQRAKDLVSQILAFSRKEERGRNIVNIVPVLKEALDFLRGSLPSSVIITHHFPTKHCPVRANPTELLQVIMNISTNAVQAMDDNGEISITFEVKRFTDPIKGIVGELGPGKYCVLTIRDTGVGMTPDMVSQIFEPYYTTKPMGRGTGLGLSVVYGIMRSHRGNIAVHSLPNVGTTIHLYLPVVQTNEIATTMDPRSTSSLEQGEGHILLVDDEPALVEVGERILTMLGYTVTCTTSSKEALTILRDTSTPIDLLITDQTMPDFTGTDLVQAARVVRPDLHILLITGFNAHIDKDNAKAQGIEHFYMKPLELHEFAKAVKRALLP